jgi:hypothetical protein
LTAHTKQLIGLWNCIIFLSREIFFESAKTRTRAKEKTVKCGGFQFQFYIFWYVQLVGGTTVLASSPPRQTGIRMDKNAADSDVGRDARNNKRSRENDEDEDVPVADGGPSKRVVKQESSLSHASIVDQRDSGSVPLLCRSNNSNDQSNTTEQEESADNMSQQQQQQHQQEAMQNHQHVALQQLAFQQMASLAAAGATSGYPPPQQQQQPFNPMMFNPALLQQAMCMQMQAIQQQFPNSTGSTPPPPPPPQQQQVNIVPATAEEALDPSGLKEGNGSAGNSNESNNPQQANKDETASAAAVRPTAENRPPTNPEDDGQSSPSTFTQQQQQHEAGVGGPMVVPPMFLSQMNAYAQLLLMNSAAAATATSSSSSSSAATPFQQQMIAFQQPGVYGHHHHQTAAASEAPVFQYRRGITLAIATDHEQLSAYQILVRQQLEVFEAGPDDVDSNMQGRKKSIVLGQVGLRCKHCAPLSLRNRSRGAVYYPAKLQHIYQAAQNMAWSHLIASCHQIPAQLQNEIRELREKRDNAVRFIGCAGPNNCCCFFMHFRSHFLSLHQ